MVGRPVLTTVALCLATFAAQTAAGAFGVGLGTFALSLPLGHRSWTLVTSVYAHGGIGHLLANAVALLLVGPPVAYVTTPARFHAFFVLAGSIAGIVQVVVAIPFGGAAVLGASGAIFALLGYLLVGNRASERLLSWLPIGGYGRLLVFAAVAAVLTLLTATPGAALVAHFAGFCLGAVTGRFRALHAGARGR